MLDRREFCKVAAVAPVLFPWQPEKKRETLPDNRNRHVDLSQHLVPTVHLQVVYSSWNNPPDCGHAFMRLNDRLFLGCHPGTLLLSGYQWTREVDECGEFFRETVMSFIRFPTGRTPDVKRANMSRLVEPRDRAEWQRGVPDGALIEKGCWMHTLPRSQTIS